MKTIQVKTTVLIACMLSAVAAFAQQETASEFQQQLKAVFDASQSLSKAFVASDAAAVQARAKEVSAALDAVNMHLLDDDPHMAWMEHLGVMEPALKTMQTSSDLRTQRKALAPFSETLYQSVKTFGIDGTKAYLQYCPMALDNAGAAWLSAEKEILNPYFGDRMLRCGSTREVIE